MGVNLLIMSHCTRKSSLHINEALSKVSQWDCSLCLLPSCLSPLCHLLTHYFLAVIFLGCQLRYQLFASIQHHTSHLHFSPVVLLLSHLNMILSLSVICSCGCYAFPSASPSPPSLCIFISLIISSASSVSLSAVINHQHHRHCLDSMGGFILFLFRADAPRLQNLPVESKALKCVTSGVIIT